LKQSFKLTTLLLIVILIIGCNKIMEDVKNNDWPSDGLYFTKWKSHHTYTNQETPILQLATVLVHKSEANGNLPKFQQLLLMAKDKEYGVELIDTREQTGNNSYTLFTLVVRLPRLDVGTYEFSKIKIKDKNSEIYVHSIGTWKLDVIDSQLCPRCGKSISNGDLTIGKKTFASGAFDWYQIELTNNASEDITIKDLSFDIGDEFEIKITESNEFNGQYREGNSILQDNEMKSFRFTFIPKAKETAIPSFISIKPILMYEMSSGKENIFPLDTVIYTKMVTDENMIVNSCNH
jgi:hypothetical protein